MAMALTATLVVIPVDMRDLVLKELVAITAIFASTAAVSLLVFFEGVNAAINDAAPGLSQILLGLLFAAVFFAATGVDTDAGDNGTDADKNKKVRPFKTCSSTARWVFGKCVSSFRQQLVFFIREMRAFGLSN